LRLLPGETAGLNLRLVDPSASWLRLVDERVVVEGPGPPEQVTRRNDGWWSDMLKKGKSGGWCE
jgi:hypothetical protein